MVNLFLKNKIGFLDIVKTINLIFKDKDFKKHAKKKPKSIKESQLDLAKQYIMANIANSKIKPARVAEELGISVRYLHWLFKQTNETFTQFLTRKRIDLAQLLLASSSNETFNVTEVAFMCGFNDSTHFSRRFKQQVGIPPSKFRKNRKP